MKSVSFSPGRVVVIGANTLLEAVRQKVFTLLVLLALVFVGGAQFFRALNFGASELKFICDIGFGATTLFGSVLAIVVAAQLFFSEIEHRTALTLLAKPVLRSEFVLGKYLGVVALLLVFTVLVGAALVVVLFVREQELSAVITEDFSAESLVSYGGLVWFFGLQWLKFGLIAAFTLLLASFAQSSLFAVVMAFLVLVVCHLQYLAIDAWEHVSGTFARGGAAVVGHMFPNFQMFNVGDRLASGGTLALSVVAGIAAYALAYIAVLLALTVFSFRRREI